jgi:hypothetical protein
LKCCCRRRSERDIRDGTWLMTSTLGMYNPRVLKTYIIHHPLLPPQNPLPTSSTPIPLRRIPTPHLQIIPRNRRLQPRIPHKPHPVNPQPTRYRLLMRRRDRKVTRLLVQHKHVAMRRRRASGRRGPEVAGWGSGSRFEHRCAVLNGRRGARGVVCEEGVQDGCRLPAGGTVDVWVLRVRLGVRGESGRGKGADRSWLGGISR